MSFKTPLADQMRPQDLSQIVGQQELLTPGQPLRQIIDQHVNIPLLLWGPPGTGKTSLAKIIAQQYNYPFESFNASTDNKAKLTKQIDKYPDDSFVLLIDEIHRMTKTLQDFLLPYLENGHVMLIGSTTENPIMSIVPAIRSRSQIFEFKSLNDDDILTVLKRAVNEVYKLTDSQFDSEALKLMAGSDTDAALYYLAVLLKNNDLPSVVRRLREIPYTYIGLANPQQVTQIVTAANQAEKIGMPKAKYPLMFATMLMCISPKSGSFDETWERLDEDTEHPNEHPMPRGLRDMHYKHSEEITGGGLIDSPFAAPHQIAQQNYMPKGLEGRRYYYPKDNANEQKLGEQYLKLHKYIYQTDYDDQK